MYFIKDPHLELRAKWKAHDWRGHSLSGDAATTALLHRWNLLGKHLLNTSETTAAQAYLLNTRSQMEGTNPASTSAPSKTQGKCWREDRKNGRAGWRGARLCRNFLLIEAFPPAKRTEGPKAQEVNKTYKTPKVPLSRVIETCCWERGLWSWHTANGQCRKLECHSVSESSLKWGGCCSAAAATESPILPLSNGVCVLPQIATTDSLAHQARLGRIASLVCYQW